MAPTGAGPQQPLYLEVGNERLFGVMHDADPLRDSGISVLFCPPFGWDEICAHRAFLHWAETLAAAGHRSLRIDLPGAGESSGSPRDPGRLDVWRDGVAGAGAWLAATERCRRVVALGVGLGGMLACLAWADGAPIDDLVLWGVPARGRSLVRELRVFSRIADAEIKLPDGAAPPATTDGSLEVAGFVLTAETLASLEGLDLTAHSPEAAADRSVLLLDRDGLPADRDLHEHLSKSAGVKHAPGDGYASMMVHPELTEMPATTFGTSLEWLARLPRGSRPAAGAVPTAVRRVELATNGARITESPFELELGGGVMRGTLVEPAPGAPRHGLCVVLANSGAVRRIGPSRGWVEASRRWAAIGVTSLRLDLLAIGDGDGDEREFRWTGAFYRPQRTRQLLAALDALAARGVAERFVLAGLCSGAYWSFHAALADERVRATMLINPWWFQWRDSVPLRRYARLAVELVRSGDLREIARLARTEQRLTRAVRAALEPLRVAGRARSPQKPLDATGEDFAVLHERGVQTLLLLGYGEALERELTSSGLIGRTAPWPGVVLERIPVADHTFRPVWAQRFVQAALDGWLERILASEVDARDTPGG